MTLLPIILPKGYTAKVSVGDKVEAGTVLAYKKDFKEEVVHLLKNYGINFSKKPKLLKRGLGDRVDEQTVLAVKKKLIGTKKILSPFQGTIVKIDEIHGDVYVKTNLEEKGDALLSPVAGTIDSCDNEKIVVKSDKDAISLIQVSGQNTKGILEVLEKPEPEFLSIELKDKIILISTTTRLFVFKAIGVGAQGLISESIDEGIFEELLEKQIKTPVCVVENQGFEKLKKENGKMVSINQDTKSILIE